MRDISMNICKVIAVAVVSVSSIPMLGQVASASSEQSATVQDGSTQVSEPSDVHAGASAQSAASAAAEMRPVTAELQGKLDSKTTRVGDAVAVKTKAAVKTADGTVLPKGTRLTGHVTDVQAHESGSSEARMGFLFDRAELKSGQSLAIHTMMQSIEPPVNALAASSVDGNEGFAGGPVGGGARVAGNGRLGGGGLVGGAVGGVTGTAESVGAGASSALGSAVGGTRNAAGNVVGGATASAGDSVHAVAGVSGGVVAHATGVPGVALAGSASMTSSGTLFASKKNIHLDDGTQVVLGVAAAASVK